MAKQVSFKGLQETFVTFKSALTRGTDENKFVKMSSTETVELCSTGELFIGKVVSINDAASASGICSVQEGGYFHDISYSGTAPSLGKEDLLVSGDPSVLYEAGNLSYSGVAVNVVKLDTTNQLISFKLIG